MPKVSVIIPVYNTAKYLRKCLDSVCNQTLSDIEIICVNDCSTDNSFEILKEYSSKDKRIKLIDFKENKGAAVARNAGIDETKGEYIGFVDSDDFIDLDFYEKLYNKATETGADVAKSNLIFENFKNEGNNKEYHNLREVRISKLNLNHIPTTLIKKIFLTNNKISFPETLKNAEDSVFEVIVGAKANKIEIVESIYYHYNYNNLSLNNSTKYSFFKIENIIHSLSMIVDILNTENVDKKIYKKMISYRYNTLTTLFLYKCNEVYNNIEKFNNLILELKSKIKYQINDINKHNLELAAKIHKIPFNIENAGITIPQKIFYVWLGGKKTSLVNICIENWHDKLKDFEIIEVNESSHYFDFEKAYNTCLWFKTVYDRKLWAYVADYIRCKILYDQGGVYLDTDITINRDITPLLKNKFFIGLEKPHIISAGIIGSEKNHPLLKRMLDFYQYEIFNSPLYVITHIITEEIANNNSDNITIYPEEYFYPYYGDEEFTHACITPSTYAIHWWNSSWRTEEQIFFLENKHKIKLEDMKEAFKRHRRLKMILSNTQKNGILKYD